MPDESATNGGWGATSRGLTKLEVRVVKGYQNNAVSWGLPAATGLNTLIFHELAHITGPGDRLQSVHSGATPGSESFKSREGKTSTIGSAAAGIVGVPFSCVVGACK